MVRRVAFFENSFYSFLSFTFFFSSAFSKITALLQSNTAIFMIREMINSFSLLTFTSSIFHLGWGEWGGSRSLLPHIFPPCPFPPVYYLPVIITFLPKQPFLSFFFLSISFLFPLLIHTNTYSLKLHSLREMPHSITYPPCSSTPVYPPHSPF